MTQGGRARERLHHRRLHELPRRRSPRKTSRRSWSSRPTASRTSPTPRRTSRPRRARCSASTTRTAPNPIRKLLEVQREHVLPGPHLQAHHDGLHQRHRGHAEPVRVLEDVLRALVPAGVHHGHRRRRRRRRSRCLPLVEKYWGGWKPGGGAAVEIPQEPAPKGPRLRARAVDQRHAAVGDGGLPVAGVRRDAQGLRGASTSHRRAVLRPHLRALQASWSWTSRRSTSWSSTCRATSTRRCSPIFARVKNPEDAVYVRDEILATFASARARAGASAARGGREVEQPLRLRAHARQHRADRVGDRRRSRPTSAPTTRSTTTTARSTR